MILKEGWETGHLINILISQLWREKLKLAHDLLSHAAIWEPSIKQATSRRFTEPIPDPAQKF